MTQGADSWENDPLWYKDAILYQLHVKAYFDSNNDGIGDFRGLTEKLNYIRDLGVNTLWLLPFYPSPMRDDGYDISDYRNIFPDYGTRRDFRTFVREAHKRGLKVITELVINHTSDQHPWFQAARRAPHDSKKRDFYVWSDDDKRFPETRIIFTDMESSNWAWDPIAQQYYWHRFFSHQPDLNHNNPEVVKAVIRTLRFWLDQGVDGVRLDAIPYLCVREGSNNENLPETHAVIKQMRAVVDEHYQNRMFLAEANQWPEDVRDYFGDGDECHMAYHFPLMPRMYMAVAQEDRHPIVEIMDQTPDIPENCQWAIFLRNHDELTLEMVTDRERDYMYQRYASDRRMRLNVGIRRRLAPLMDNDPDKIKLMNSLLLSMPGSPIIYYGDELGMGDNFFLGDRNGVRTPMQWSPDRNAGFSKADPQRLYLPPIMDPIYGYEAVNVEAQSRDPSSLLNWMKRMLAIRSTFKVFGRGSLKFLRPGNRKILAYTREWQDQTVLCVVNLSRHAQPVELDLSAFRGQVPTEMMGHTPFPPIGDLPYLLTLPGYGVYWFRLLAEGEIPPWHEELLPPMELATLVLADGWRSFFPAELEISRRPVAERLRNQLEQQVLPKYISSQRWFGAKGEVIERVQLQPQLAWAARDMWLIAWAKIWFAGGETQSYFLPLATVWSDDEERIRPLLHFTLAKVRQQARVGILCEAFADEHFCGALVEAIGHGQEIETAQGRLVFTPTSAYPKLVQTPPSELVVRRPGSEGSNTSVILGNELFLKAYRRLQDGLNPELEMGRFLTEQTDFDNIIPVAGSLEWRGAEGGSATLALLQGYVANQGDAWSYTLNYLERSLEQLLTATPEELLEEQASLHASYLPLIETLGTRTGELHQALASKTGDPAFDPEPVSKDDLRSWGERMRNDARKAMQRLQDAEHQPEISDLAAHVLSLRARIDTHIDSVVARDIPIVKTRHHGDYHLGQVLVVENDFVIIDFEGEPARPVNERRAKHLALRDVAGMLRSFSYAAHVALDRLSVERPDHFDLLKPFATQWEQHTAQSFLAGYRKAIEGCPVYPEQPEDAQALLDWFVLEKVLYEIVYELDNRPDWVTIPLGGLISLLEGETEKR